MLFFDDDNDDEKQQQQQQKHQSNTHTKCRENDILIFKKQQNS